MALAQVGEHTRLHEAMIKTLGADKAYHQNKFVTGCRERGIAPLAACKDSIRVKGFAIPYVRDTQCRRRIYLSSRLRSQALDNIQRCGRKCNRARASVEP